MHIQQVEPARYPEPSGECLMVWLCEFKRDTFGSDTCNIAIYTMIRAFYPTSYSMSLLQSSSSELPIVQDYFNIVPYIYVVNM